MRKTLIFEVQGSEAEPYEVRFIRDEDTLIATCTCISGHMGRGLCKHRLDLLEGDITHIVSHNLEDDDELHSIVTGTTAEPAFKAMRGGYEGLRAANVVMDEAKAVVKKAEEEMNRLKDALFQKIKPPDKKRK